MLLAIDSPANENVALTQVKAWKFHVDFATPANSTFGVGANHSPNSVITVDPFVDAFTNATGFTMVPQQGTAKIDTLGDKIMTPVVYQNIGGTESLWADHRLSRRELHRANGCSVVSIRCDGRQFPATPVQQQTWSNGGDGLYRFMPSIAVENGNMAIGYSVSSTPSSRAFVMPGVLPVIRQVNGPGEATMFDGPAKPAVSLGRLQLPPSIPPIA